MMGERTVYGFRNKKINRWYSSGGGSGWRSFDEPGPIYLVHNETEARGFHRGFISEVRDDIEIVPMTIQLPEGDG